mgnify:CR=1 FL=1
MHLPFNYNPSARIEEKPAIVCTVTREDAIWNRPIFRAPPLRITPPAVNFATFRALPGSISTVASR